MTDFKFKTIDQMSGREHFCVERLRLDTFVTQQKITVAEADDLDLVATHVFLLNQDETNALATCRIFRDHRQWILGRVAVSATMRSQQLGRKMLEAVHAYLAAQGVFTLSCHAQVQAQGFYERLGYEILGEPFPEAGIDHILMCKRLV